MSFWKTSGVLAFGLLVSMDTAQAQTRDQDLFIWAKQPEAQFRAFASRNNGNLKAVDPENGRTLMHFAAMCTSPSSGTSIAFVKRNGGKADGKDIYNITPLMKAADALCYTGVRELVSYGADINARDVNGWQAIHHWGKGDGYGGKYTLEALVSAGSDINSIDNFQGYTPLFHAVTNWDDKRVKYLLERGADPNIKDFKGQLLKALSGN